MSESELVRAVLIEGAIGGTVISSIALVLTRLRDEQLGLGFLAVFLIVAAGAYFGFAIGAHAGPGWMLIELLQSLAFGALALLGLWRSPTWLALGWALHPLWDVGLHYFGPGRSFAPFTYAIACVTFDLVVAGYIVVAHSMRRHAPRRLATAAR